MNVYAHTIHLVQNCLSTWCRNCKY